MLSIRTQDRMALVPYDSKIKISMNFDETEEQLNDSRSMMSEWYSLSDEEQAKNKDAELWVKYMRKHRKFVILHNELRLGYYPTKERALEILDEIENYVRGVKYGPKSDGIRVWEAKQTLNNVYQMPKE
jgi:hypothetical protein